MIRVVARWFAASPSKFPVVLDLVGPGRARGPVARQPVVRLDGQRLVLAAVDVVRVLDQHVVEGAEAAAAVDDRGRAQVERDEVVEEVRRLAVRVDDLGLPGLAEPLAELQRPLLGERRVQVVDDAHVREGEAAAGDAVVGEVERGRETDALLRRPLVG
jgi:hypothetical protein